MQSLINKYYSYINVVRRRKWLVLSVFVTVVLTASINTFRQAKVYEANTIIEIGSEIPDVAFFKEVVSVNPTNWWSIGRYYETQYKIIRSDSLLSKVSARIIKEKIWPASKTIADDKLYLGRLKGLLSVNPIGESRLVKLTCRDTDRQHIAEVCDTVALVYIQENLNRKLVSAKDAVSWLSEQMASFEEDKKSSELALQSFKEKYQILSLENPREVMDANLRLLIESLNQLTKERLRIEARYKQLEEIVKTSKDVEDLFGVVESDLLDKLKSAYIDQERKFLVLSIRYGQKHPEIVRAQKEITELKKKISREVNDEVKRLKTRYLLAKAEEDRVKTEYENKKLEALEFDRVSYQLQNIVRAADTNQRFFLALNEKLKEADLSGLVKSNNIRIVDKAKVPGGHVFPRTGLNIILSIFIGLIGGIGAAFFWNYLDATYKTQQDVESDFDAPFLGIVPLIKASEDSNDAANDTAHRCPEVVEFCPTKHPNSTVAEMYRNIRTNLTFTTSPSGNNLLLVTSTSPEEGKTATSINLALTFAQLGQRVLLLDGDLRRPSIHRHFELSNDIGFSNLLINTVDFSEAVIDSNIENLSIVTSGPTPPNPSELLGSEQTSHILELVKSRYDKIIIDGCPIVPISDSLILSQKVDGIVFVVLAEGPHRNVVLKAKSQLEKIGSNFVGCILNGVPLEHMDMGHRYSYYGYYNRYVRSNNDEINLDSTNV